MQSIFNRTSVRKFLGTEVEADKIEMILKAAMAAPSASNQQPWEIYVVTNEQVKKELSVASPYGSFLKDSPIAFAVCYRDDGKSPDFAIQDCSAAIQNMLLTIDHLELGGVWIGIGPKVERMEVVTNTLKLPSHIHPLALIACGYPAEKPTPKDKFNPERVHFIK